MPPTMTFDGSGIVRCSCGGECRYVGRSHWDCQACHWMFCESDENVIVRAMTDKERFVEHLKWASRVVSTWPKWKREVLGRTPMIETRESWVCRFFNRGSALLTIRSSAVEMTGDPYHLDAEEAAIRFVEATIGDIAEDSEEYVVEVQHTETEWRRYRVTCRVVRQYSAEEVK